MHSTEFVKCIILGYKLEKAISYNFDFEVVFIESKNFYVIEI